MSRQIYEYEIELRYKRRGQPDALVTRTEHAYSILDAAHQAIVVVASMDPDAEDITITKVGPPAELIARAAQELAQQIQRSMETLTTSLKVKAK